MSSQGAPASVRASGRILPLPAAALVASVGALLVVAAHGSAPAARLALVAGVGCVVAEWVRRMAVAARGGRAGTLGVAVLGLVVGVGAAIVVGQALTVAYAWATVCAEAGVVVLLAARASAGARTPWESLGDPGGVRRRQVGLALAGVVLLLAAAYLAIAGWTGLRAMHPVRAVALGVSALLVTGAAGIVLIVRGLRTPISPAYQRHETEVAAHLHDSVLQTLALIGRTADDPTRVRLLARQQERSLRAYLAGRDEAVDLTLVGALRSAAEEVEDETPGAVIEVVAVGDVPCDPAAEAMVRAAREAMRNAARHAGSPVRVFVELTEAARELYVRDAGAGFTLAEVPDERRGVRDAIIGRMEHAGGSATIESGPTGTDVMLRWPAAGLGEGNAASA